MFSFDWDEANLAHISLHRVTREEAEEVLRSPTFELDTYEIDGEERVEELGCTSRGRILKIVTVIRSGVIRVVTAYDPSKTEKLAFLEFQGRLYE